MKIVLIAVGMLVLGAAAFAAESKTLDSFEGENGAWALDGKQIAFQRHNGRDYDVGVFSLADRSITWVSADKGEAAYPTWAQDGSLIYSYCALSQTAYEAQCTHSQEGFNLYRYSTSGKREQLTQGRFFDATPSVARDGAIWFASTRGCEKNTVFENVNLIWRWCVGGKLESLYASKGNGNCGVNSPVVSPNGKLVVWAELRNFWDAWTLMIARVDSMAQTIPLLPPDCVGYSPAWHPDGKHIFFTGYRIGDEGWHTYILNAATGTLCKREKGMNPALSRDGTKYLYDDGHTIFVKNLELADLEGEVLRQHIFTNMPEKVLLHLDKPKRDDTGKMPPTAALKRDAVSFARAECEWDGDASKYQVVFWGGWQASALGCQLYFAMGTPHFATRSADNVLFSVSSGKIYPHDKPIKITGIRTPQTIYVSVNDGPPVARPVTVGLIDTQQPTMWRVGHKANDTTHFKYIEFGTGWPTNVPAPKVARDLFEDGK